MPTSASTPSSSSDSISDVRNINIGPLIFDVALCGVVAFLFAAIPPLAIEPFRRGFFCDDESIRYPAKNDTIPIFLLAIILIVLVALMIGLVELFRIKKLSGQDTAVYRIRDIDVHRWLVRFCAFSAHCVLCALVTVILFQATKYAVGRLRPNFLAVCKPNLNLTSCETSHDYITDYECTGEDKSAIRETRLSFFSGHSALSMCVAVYLVLYLQARLPRRTYGISLLPLLQTVLIIGAVMVGYSRIDDHKHHWSDVLVGLFVGATAGVISAVCFAQLFQRQNAMYRSAERLPLIDGDTREGKDPRKGTVMSNISANGHVSDMVTTIPVESDNM